MRTLTILFVATLLATPLLPAQSSKPRFAVASVKENKSSDAMVSNIPLDRSSAYTSDAGTLTATGQPLLAYIVFAYKMEVSESADGLVRKLPDWVRNDRFDINAKSDLPNPSKDDLRLMMQSLLEDRFKLVVHRYSKPAPVFFLTFIKPDTLGPQLRHHTANLTCSGTVPEHPSRLPASALIGVWPAYCGDGEVMRATATLDRTAGRGMTMSAIASWLTGIGDAAGYVDRPIVDRTGLTGTYDFILDYSFRRPGTPIPDDAVQNNGLTFLEALNDQLGLRIEKGEGEATFFSIDHVEYPTAN